MRLQVTPKHARDDDPGVVAALLECHARIRSFMEVAARLAALPDGTRHEDIVEAATGVASYFGEALPHHEADEEESLRPRVAGRDADVDVMLDEMTRQHEKLHGPTATLVALTGGVATAPETLTGETATRLGETVAVLEPLWREHLDLEENDLFPALERMLGERELADIRAEMRGRR